MGTTPNFKRSLTCASYDVLNALANLKPTVRERRNRLPRTSSISKCYNVRLFPTQKQLVGATDATTPRTAARVAATSTDPSHISGTVIVYSGMDTTRHTPFAWVEQGEMKLDKTDRMMPSVQSQKSSWDGSVHVRCNGQWDDGDSNSVSRGHFSLS